MKVAIVHSYYSSRQSSGENIVVDAQVEALREHGISVRVVSAHTDQLEASNGYKARAALTVATGRGPSPVNQLERYGPDIVHVHNLFPNWGSEWLRRWEGPIVATMHNFRPVCSAGTLFRDGKNCTACPDGSTTNALLHGCYRGSRTATLPLAISTMGGVQRNALLSRADRVIVLSNRARMLYERFGLPSDKIIMIPNFVSDVGFDPTKEAGHSWVYVGRLSEEKGIRNLLKYWPDDERLKIYGDGPLRSLVESKVTNSANIIYHGHLDRRDISEALASSRGLIFPSECVEGGIPLSYVEALAAGRPVVALAGSSAADDVASSGAGKVFESWDGLQTALRTVSTNALSHSKNARENYAENYVQKTYLNRIEALYMAVSGSREGQR